MRLFDFPIRTERQATRIFYGALAAFASVYATWSLGQMALNPPPLPLGLNWPFVNNVFLSWVVVAGAAAVWPASRLLRILCAILVAFCCYVDHLWHGWWMGFVAVGGGSVIFAISTVSQADTAEQREGVLPWLQILLCGYLVHEGRYFWFKQDQFWAQAVIVACWLVLAGVLLHTVLRPKNLILSLLGVMLIFYFAFAWSDESIAALALALAVPLMRHHMIDGRWPMLSHKFHAR